METNPVRLLEPADVWIHGAVALGALGALLSGPLLESPQLAGDLGLSIEAAVWIHRLAALAVLVAGCVHVVRVCIRWLTGGNPWGLVPSPTDLGEFGRALAWGLFLRRTPPRYGRYSYRERVSYAAFAAGVWILLATGWASGHPGAAFGVVGPEGLLLAARLHAAAGLLLVPFLVWHLYFAHFQPGVLPWNGAWLTGWQGWERVERVRPGWAQVLAGEPLAEPAAPQPEKASVESLLEIGNRAAREGRYAEAEAAYVQALTHYPGYSQALFNLGVVRSRAGDAEGARDALTRFLEQDPFSPVAQRAQQILADLASGASRG